MSSRPEPFPGVFPGTIGTSPDLAALVAASDLVCIARVTGVRRLGTVTYLVNGEPAPFERVAASLDVERGLAGSAVEPAEVEMLELDEPSALARLAEGERAALFLVRRGARYALADPVTAAIDLARPHEDVRRVLVEAQESADAEVARIAAALLAELTR
jgi:hypothetical protein